MSVKISWWGIDLDLVTNSPEKSLSLGNAHQAITRRFHLAALAICEKITAIDVAAEKLLKPLCSIVSFELEMVVKSMAASTSQCALRKVLHDPGRTGVFSGIETEYMALSCCLTLKPGRQSIFQFIVGCWRTDLLKRLKR